jgi:hypothetical protein
VLQVSEDERIIHGVVAGYYDAFVRDSTAASIFYGEPALIVLPNEVFSLPTRKDVERFLANALSGFLALGYSNTQMSASRIKKLNETTALYGTIASRFKSDGTELERTAFTYLLHKGNSGWKIHQLIATDVDKLIDPAGDTAVHGHSTLRT